MLAGEKRFTLLRLRVKPNGMAIGRVRTERGRLVRAPIVDAFGYSFVVMAADGTLRVKRRDFLRPVACDDDAEDEGDTRARYTDARSCDMPVVRRLF